MSSPPPTTPNPLNPRKRPSISSVASSSQAKRQRMHPLRQTSFPIGTVIEPETTRSRAASDAGSVTGSFTGSLGGSSSALDGLKKRGRKKKADKERENASTVRGGAADGRSTRVGSADIDRASVRGGTSGVGGGGNDEAGDEDEEQDVEGELLGGTEGFLDLATEKKNLAVLTGSFTPLQADRYEKWNRTRLRKETLRRIVNHALSQSVPQSVVTVVNGFTKVFIGEIIEKARTVQEQWAEAFDIAARDAWLTEQAELQVAAAEKARAEAEAKAKERANAKDESAAASGSVSESMSASVEPKDEKETNALKHESQSPVPPNNIPATLPSTGQQANGFNSTPETSYTVPEFVPPVNPHRGQLLPDHIREAFRRYKHGGDGGGTGMSGLSQPTLGVRGSFTWHAGTGGSRLFR